MKYRLFASTHLFLIFIQTVFADTSTLDMKKKLLKVNPQQIKQVSVPVVYENGILFTFAGKDDDTIFVSGSFWGWAKKIKMLKNDLGIYYAFLRLAIKKGKYSYRYQVNGIWLNDPQQTFMLNDGYGTRISALQLKRNLNQYIQSPIKLAGDRYKFVLRDRGYKKVSWIGTLNNWDPYVSQMTLVDGYWQIELSIKPGKRFYRYWIDGKTFIDELNLNTTLRPGGEKVSYCPLPSTLNP